MSIHKTDVIARQLESFSGLIQEISQRLAPFDTYADPEGLAQLRGSFKTQSEDFFSEQRKFNLAILGQVKAGKSSFLNMLLFDGEPVLPRAATPKTSALTRIEYAQQNQLTVEYITLSEWNGLHRLAASALETPQVRAARETIALSVEMGTPVESCLAKCRETIYFNDYSELNSLLDDCVGDAGKLTPMVKYVTLGLAMDCLQNLSVVDTPGLNDPLSSRTERTRQFIGQCDAAFFLSRSSYFLDKNDLLLLTSQLPQKGIGRLILVASQYDSALMDTVSDFNDLSQADLETRLALRRHVSQSVDEAVRIMRRSGGAQSIIEVIEQCRRPIFTSVVAQKMAAKLPEDDTCLEQIVRRQLSLEEPITEQELLEIGNFDEVRAVFDSLIAEKEELLQRKAATFVVTAQSNLRVWLASLQAIQAERQTALESTLRRLEQRQLQLSQRINCLQTALSVTFEHYFEPLDGALTHAIFELNRMQTAWNSPPTRAKLDVVTRSKTVSATRWNHPGTWGKKYKRYYTEETVSEIMDPEDVRIYLMQFWTAASDLCAEAFVILENTPPLTNAIYRLVDEQFAPESTVRQPERLRALVTHALSLLDCQMPPLAPYDLLPTWSKHTVSDPLEQQALCEEVRTTMVRWTDTLRSHLLRVAAALRDSGRSAQETLQEGLCMEMAEERAALLVELASVRREMTQRRELVEILEWYQ